ncbi:hypothetical protein BC939DRAFT_470251 [Gamsiella multidivaricata]|uniref:uncharacterized protein n=1 Tax=Gamsiella multidivaricata TaxID=101098 RepID=UPI0022204F6F|nr:uncharacterized protein BC939DRAFT_470251 [Gamsiella multidivaricata]KAI7816126.1 hypothetical protein BC939DRAFT_470251 [Gamsiella multidivaricata]
MVDCSQTETEALRQSFKTLDIYYCSFHVAQAWERKAKEYHGASAVLQRFNKERKRVEWQYTPNTLSSFCFYSHRLTSVMLCDYL